MCLHIHKVMSILKQFYIYWYITIQLYLKYIKAVVA